MTLLANSSPLCKVCNYKHLCMPESIVNAVVSSDYLDQIASTISTQITLLKGSLAYSQGDVFSSIYVIRSGCLKTYSLDEKGEELIEGIFYPGEFLALDCISFKCYSHFAIAKEDSDVCRINYHELETFAKQEPEMAIHASKAISSQLSKQLKWSQTISNGNIKKRICSWILITSSKLGINEKNEYRFLLPINHYEIAKILKMRPESLSRALKELNEEGFVNISNKDCHIKNRDALLSNI